MAFLSLGFGSDGARAQAPYLIPYTINTVAGGGIAPVIGATCAGAGGGQTAQDTFGNGCLASSSSVVTNTDIHDVGVDPMGNVYFIDIATYTTLRKIDARSGLINIVAGTTSTAANGKTVCASSIDAYGDNCTANDGKANFSGANTANLGKSRGISVAKNGDIYIADYGVSLIHKISGATGVMTLVAGFESGATTVKTVGSSGYTGDGSSAIGAKLFGARGVAVDASGNLYIADTGNNVIRMVTASTGTISTIVGANPNNGSPAPGTFSGDAGPASKATLFAPEDVEIDANGNLFIADYSNNRVRVVYGGGATVANLITLTNPTVTVPTVGYIYTVMGGGTPVYTPNTIVSATSVAFGTGSGVRKIAIDSRGNIYTADNSDDVVFFLDATTGFMRTIAGTYGKTSGATCTGQIGTIGDNCPATLATLNPSSAMGIAVGPQGDVYISDSGDARIRKISQNTSFPAVASGSSVTQTLLVHFAAADTPASSSAFLIAGSPDFAVSGAPACTTNSIADNTSDCTVSIVFSPTRPGADSATLIVKSSAGFTTRLALSGVGTASSVALDPGNTALLASSLATPGGVTQDAAGNVFVADTGNNRVLQYTAGGTSTVIAGTGASGYTGDGAAATAAKLSGPRAVAVAPDGVVYIADTGNSVIRRIDPVTGFISTFGGGAGSVCVLATDSLGDGCIATSAKFSAPAGLVADPTGNLYVSDTGNNVIREISTTGYVFPIAGGATVCTTPGADIFGNTCAPAQAIFKSPTALQIDNARNVYIADTGNNEVRKITVATNLVSVVAGTGQPGGSGNGGLATTAQVSAPTGIAIDAAGNLYIADTANHVVRVVNGAGTINTVVGTLGSSGAGTLPGSASGVLLKSPGAVIASGIGKLYVLDSGNNRLFSLDRGAVSLNFGRTNVGSSSPATIIQETATGSTAASLGFPIFTTSGSTSVFTLAPSGPNGCSSTASTFQALAPGASCGLSAQFAPTAVGLLAATYTESNTAMNPPTPPVVNSPVPAIILTGTGAVLTRTTLATAVTTPATGSPQYSIAFIVTATLHPVQCDPTAPNCSAAGTVTFFVDGTQVGLPLAVSNTGTTSTNVVTASQTINGQSVGTHAIVAVYSGDTYYASSTASTLSVSVAQGTTTAVVSAAPSTAPQFSNLALTAQVSSTTKTIPTGSIAFYAGATLLGSAGVDGSTGIASLLDVFTTDAKGNITTVPQSFGLYAGTYNLTAVYSGDSNYAASTSVGTPLIISADAPGFAIAKCITYNTTTGCSSAAVGTAQGSTATILVYVVPSNTLNGTLTFACSGLPANSVCTFSATTGATQTAGSTLTFAPVPGAALAQTTVPGATVVGGAIANPAPPLPASVTVTLWTNVNPNVNSASSVLPIRSHSHSRTSTLAGLCGWPMLLGGLTTLFGFRRRLRNARLLTVLALFALLTGSAGVMTGCISGKTPTGPTPVGTYTVTLTVTGPNGLAQSTPITFTVGAGIAGQS